ncbi:MAG: helix-turn-helix transcriptional regulator [Fluviicola sp.]|nr:helix-turn-helix transcriptional regulator [Fluviicola sp.]
MKSDKKSDTKDTEQEYLKKLMERIVKLRKERGMSQETLANESHISRSLMRGYERGERNISFANLVRIIKFGLKMKVEDFFSEGFDV